ncbi:MAG: DUF2586 family protein [Candidatus Pedobacter colombiensis]|uniref:DUF2586 family protein n=1 Tax=Candidatus Pedobacter colombiensis TaxID=3121371 RepID=A0AAJ6B5H8_9SPHI|nr:DUF2586 family protein [Pedobacter sp.]WEK18180.1 MAG: DUF2586 family protein [Pedobacter sp.]
MARDGISIKLLNGGLGRRQPTEDAVFGFVSTGMSTETLEWGKVYQLKGTRDAKLLGLDEEYDKDNNSLLYHHIQRFFMRNPNAELHILLAPSGASMQEMVDKDMPYGQKLLKEAGGRIKVLFVADSMGNLGSSPLSTTIATAQDLHDFEFSKFRYVDIVLEGRRVGPDRGPMGEPMGGLMIEDLRALTAPNVSVVIAQDPSATAIDPNYAAVGDFCGHLSAIAVSQNVGEQIAEFNMVDVANDAFVSANVSSGIPVSSLTDDDLDSLDDYGYIFLAPVSGLPGLYWNDSHTCTLISDDYAFIERNRVINKAIRLVRTALLPKVKGRVKVDAVTGKILPEERKALENTISSSLDVLVENGDLSGGVDAYIDPDQNILQTDEITTEITFVPVAIGRKLTLSIGFKNPLKSN